MMCLLGVGLSGRPVGEAVDPVLVLPRWWSWVWVRCLGGEGWQKEWEEERQMRWMREPVATEPVHLGQPTILRHAFELALACHAVCSADVANL